MSVAKHVEITAESEKSFEDAVKRGVKKAAETLNDVRSAWVKDQQVMVDGDDVTSYRVTMKVTFVLK